MDCPEAPQALNSPLRSFFCSTLFALLVSPAPAAAVEATWRAGAASVGVTPQKSTWMAGFGARNKPSEGTAQELFAKALVLDDGAGHRLVIVTLDLIGLPRTLRKNLEQRAQAAWRLPPEFLLLNASHTHSGPEYSIGKVPADDMDLKVLAESEEYGAKLEETLFQLIGTALSKVEPASLSYSHARAGFAMNRRLPTKTGYRNSPNPDGVVDHDVPVLRVAGADGKLRAVLFGYACHNTTLPLYQFSGDYAGYAQDFLQAGNAGAVALFLNGFSGDQNPYPRGTVELARQHGRTLATAVEAAMAANPKPLDEPLSAAFAEIALPFAPAPTREELQKVIATKDTRQAKRAGRLLAEIDRKGRLAADYPYPVQVIRFGKQITLVALGGEVVVDFSLRLKKELAGPMVWTAGYCNDVMAYIPSRRVLEEGGYEGREASLASSILPGPWDTSVEELIVAKVHDLNRKAAPAGSPSGSR
ncbi:MAG: neutral/alkaline non-lysosomal ceramidase N-terminal domain-containing protein [Verrucomicrobia bacterium]|nr:neutral/alkaline non-lysosomal ceramidase N-terminal domain-containing protein [Verrucomicrobiota bacterium]